MRTELTQAQAMLLEGDRWTDHIARLALPVLLWCARNGWRITYGQLALELERRHGEEQVPRKTSYGWPAGKIGDVLEALSEEWGEPIPPINAILVQQSSGLPGPGADGYLETFLKAGKKERLTEQNRPALAEAVIQDVLSYPRWDAVAKALGVSKLPPVTVLEESAPAAATLLDPARSYGNGGGESDEHRELKEWVAQHPGRFAEFGRFRKGRTEALLLSGDEVDVLFAGADAVLAVEVKAANAPDAELQRGVFQCVKYRAVLRAMQLAEGKNPNAQAVLVVQRRLPADLVKVARRLQVEWLVIEDC